MDVRRSSSSNSSHTYEWEVDAAERDVPIEETTTTRASHEPQTITNNLK